MIPRQTTFGPGEDTEISFGRGVHLPERLTPPAGLGSSVARQQPKLLECLPYGIPTLQLFSTGVY